MFFNRMNAALALPMLASMSASDPPCSSTMLSRRTMTPHDESRIPSEVMRPMPFLTTRKTTYLGTWNVRTIWDNGRALQIAAEMRRYNLEVLGISETHWTQVGQ
ncbi:unnamed protein product [Schistosoma margrebowiei]|uniref:Uncharacterized protein n=1 Tax=Schistosoma margrebowiei TaxID=48269 RepID=A0A183MLR5_9TREM|nr:unnamed protein product [Schistosoma margrebowiei]